MAYTCVLAPSYECDGCQECEQGERYDPKWDKEYDPDDAYVKYLEREDRSDDR